jgi:hypothetical protein
MKKELSFTAVLNFASRIAPISGIRPRIIKSQNSTSFSRKDKDNVLVE